MRWSISRAAFVMLVLAAVGGSAGSEGDEDGPPVGACAVPNTAFESLTTQVLVGTDVAPVQNFAKAAVEFGEFSSEQGGAILIVNIEEGPEGVTAKRSFTEPGVPAAERSYTDLCLVNGLIYGEAVRGKFVEGGIIWLELASDSNFISDELWRFLHKNEQDNPD